MIARTSRRTFLCGCCAAGVSAWGPTRAAALEPPPVAAARKVAPGAVAGRSHAPPFKPMLDNDRLRAWRLTPPPGGTTPAFEQRGPGLRVLLAGERVIDADARGPIGRETNVLRGDFAMLEPAPGRRITNSGGSPLDLIEFELK